MWKDYLTGLLKNNRSYGLSVRLSTFISALLLSLLCGLFYNAWKYEIERIELEEGGWQSRIIGELNQDDIDYIQNFASVKDVVVKEESGEEETAIDIYFDDMGRVLSDTPRIAREMGISPEKVIYNYQLLAMYLIRDSKDDAPRLVFPMFIVITVMASISLIVIIHNSFTVSMDTRIHQFGIFSSVGATPRQLRACLLQETAALCAVPLGAGSLLGIAGAMGLMELSNILLGSELPGRHKANPGYHPLVLILTLLVTAATIWISAWLPARKLSRLTPLEAMKNTDELQLKKRKSSHLLTFLFGVEGELAGNALKAQRKSMRTASWSLSLSFMAFTIMQCFFSLSEISTRETYFEKYQSVWDIMAVVKDIEIENFQEIEGVRELTGVESAVLYQKTAAKRIVAEGEMSEEMKSFGGFSHASEKFAVRAGNGWMVSAPIIILDDESFFDYCEQIGIAPRLNGAVIRNQIRDVTNPDFRHPEFLPYVKEENAVSVLRQPGNEEITAEIPILAYTEEVPVLREDYATLDYYELVHFIPISLWKEIKEQIGGLEEDVCIRVLGRKDVTLEELDAIQDELCGLVGRNYTAEYENRIQEYETNNMQIQGMKVVLGSFCILFAIIGIGSVFSNTLGFVRQRKREFGRYMSVGLTPGEIRKMFCIEAMVIAGRPVLITLPLAAAAVWYMLKMSYLEVEEFIAEAPLIPIAVFVLSILCAVALAYYSAWRNVCRISLAHILKDDTL